MDRKPKAEGSKGAKLEDDPKQSERFRRAALAAEAGHTDNSFEKKFTGIALAKGRKGSNKSRRR